MPNGHLPTPDFRWPGEVTCADCGVPYRPRFPGDKCPRCGPIQHPETPDITQLRRDRDELAEALKETSVRLIRRVVREKHTPACSNCQADKELYEQNDALLARVKGR